MAEHATWKYGYTTHGHPLPHRAQDPGKRPPVIRCGGTRFCPTCKMEVHDEQRTPRSIAGAAEGLGDAARILQQTQTLITELTEMHLPAPKTMDRGLEYCNTCETTYPCPTMRTLGKYLGEIECLSHY